MSRLDCAECELASKYCMNMKCVKHANNNHTTCEETYKIKSMKVVDIWQGIRAPPGTNKNTRGFVQYSGGRVESP